jgi:hypothetical protein
MLHLYTLPVVTQVRTVMADAVDLDALITALPMLTDPAVAISVLVTVKRWYHTKENPMEVLEADPDLVLRAQVRAAGGAWSMFGLTGTSIIGLTWQSTPSLALAKVSIGMILYT